MTRKVVQGAVIGGSIGALFSYLAQTWAAPNGETDNEYRANALAYLQQFPNLSADSNIYVALQEPLPLFLQIDQASTHTMLEKLDELVLTFRALRNGSTKPADVSRALQARREAHNRLLVLMRKARQQKPLCASELDEDIDSLKKSMEGYIHNSMQQSNLNIMEQ